MKAAVEDRRGALGRFLQSLRTDAVFAQGVRFAISGATVSVVYITVTTLLSQASHLRFQIALVIGWCAAVSVHFTLQRTFVWAHDVFALTFRKQIGRYLLVAGTQLGVSATTTAVFPSVLNVSAEVVYLATAAVLTLFNFLVFRGGVFHPQASDPEPVEGDLHFTPTNAV